MDLWGGTPATQCTGNAFYGCERISGAGGNILNPIQSAAVRTTDSCSITYGRVEVKAKLPVGDWLWPAIWMLPRYDAYGSWPASGEIDIMESRGNINYPPGGVDSYGSTLHFGPFWPLDPWQKAHRNYQLPSGTFHDAFHVFGLYWDESGIYTYLDNPNNRMMSVNFTEMSFWQRGGWDKSKFGNPWQGRSNSAPFDQKYYLSINLAVGGTGDYFPDGVGNKPWSNSNPQAMSAFYDKISAWYPTWKGEDCALQIDSVKMWQKN
jgi:beta-glucanase (GH16 family)